MDGKLFVYHPERRLVAFISGPARAVGDERPVVVFIGGLTDGFMASPYLPNLQARLALDGWSLVQTLLSSSYSGYGHTSLHQDVEELDFLVHHLDIVLYMKEGVHRDKVDAAILQAPVSDREYAASLPQTENLLSLATEMLAQGRGQELMPREADTAPITAYRYHSFVSRLGDDDMFSSDFTLDEAKARLGHMNLPSLVYLSMKDEYVPDGVDKEKLSVLFSHIPHALIKTDSEANHNLSQPTGAGDRFAAEVLQFLAGMREKGTS